MAKVCDIIRVLLLKIVPAMRGWFTLIDCSLCLGSTCAMLANILLAADGLRVGRFTSPHWLEPRDSIQVQGQVKVLRHSSHGTFRNK
jgi:hypothetical protein